MSLLGLTTSLHDHAPCHHIYEECSHSLFIYLCLLFYYKLLEPNPGCDNNTLPFLNGEGKFFPQKEYDK